MAIADDIRIKQDWGPDGYTFYSLLSDEEIDNLGFTGEKISFRYKAYPESKKNNTSVINMKVKNVEDFRNQIERLKEKISKDFINRRR